MPYLFAFDLDGTILPDYRVLEPRIRGAVARAMAAGHRCMIATARPLPCAGWVWDELGLDTPICLHNGATLMHPTDPDFAKWENLIDHPQTAAALDYALTRFPQVDIYLEYGCAFWVTRRPGRGYFAMLAEDCITHEFTADTRPDTPAARIGFYLNEEADMQTLADHFAADPRLTVLRQPGQRGRHRCLIYPAAADKWYAIAEAARRMGFAREEIVTFGDSWNDITMLREAGLGYAMLGGSVVEEYDYRTTTRLPCAEGGVADMIDRLIGEKKA